MLVQFEKRMDGEEEFYENKNYENAKSRRDAFGG